MSTRSDERLAAPGRIPLHGTRLLAEFGLRLMGGLTYSGAENIKDIKGPYVQSANHSSLLDIAAVGVAAYRADKQQLHYIAKDNLDAPGLGWWLAESGTIYIDRKTGLSPEIHADISERAAANAAFAAWPEGHRWRGRLKEKRLMRLVIVPLVFEHSLTVVPVGIAGTEPGELGFAHVTYGPPFKPPKVEFEPDPEWDERKRTGMLNKTIRQQLGRHALEDFMKDLFQGMSEAESQAVACRDERLVRRKIARTALVPFNKASGAVFKPKPFILGDS